MPEDSPSKPGTETRLLQLTERWATETTKIAGYFETSRDLLKSLSQCQSDLKEKIEGLEREIRDLKVAVEHPKKAGLVGVLEWMMDRAKDQPMVFAMVFITVVMFLIVLTILGYNLPALLGR